MPNAVRRVSDTISSPILPGIYKATYGYKTDAGTTVMKSGYILFIPPWFIAVLLVIIYSALNSAPTGRKSPSKQG